MSSKFLNRQLLYEMLPPGSLGSHLEISLLYSAAPLLRLQNPFAFANLLKSQGVFLQSARPGLDQAAVSTDRDEAVQ